MKRAIFFCLLSVFACQDKEAERIPVYLNAGAPMAGLAEVAIDFPMGAPMGGYSNRCDYLGRNGAVDKRRSAYTKAWSSSGGIQTRSMAKALWLTNGDQDLVVIKADVIYAFDNMVRTVEHRLEEITGRPMGGRVVITSSHTHNAPANYSDSYHFYLGGDRFNEEVYQRMTESLVEASVAAWTDMVPAAIGMGIAEDWDPDDLVYADRRSENDDLQVWPDQIPGKKKDPRVWLLRVDTASGDPLGVIFNFGIHGTTLGASNPMVSTDAPGHTEYALAARFDTPVMVAHWQGSGGDATPRGTDDHFARLETIGEYAADTIFDLWSETPTSDRPITIETVTQSIQEDLETIEVERDGGKLTYLPYDEDRTPDNILYNDDGTISTPLDEFNAEYGGAFCGYDEPLVDVGTLGIEVYPYDGCMQVELVSWLIAGVFALPADSVPLPLPSSLQAMTTASAIGPLDILQPDGSVVTEQAYFGFFPGETTQMFTEQYTRRAQDELGLSQVFLTGYSQDHEGYLLIPEDWLKGGYEPNINIWGPLQGEHIMEGNLDMFRSHLLTARLEPQDPHDQFPDTAYEVRELPENAPEETPAAGTTPSSLPDEIWLPVNTIPQFQPDPSLPRVQGLAQLMWIGGDPAVDTPEVELERLDGDTWRTVTTSSGRTVSDTLPDILTFHTPDPLYPFDAPQDHIWWAGWQTVPHSGNRTALELGTYRLHVYGQSYTGSSATWPWDSTEYETVSDPFEVTPATITVTIEESTVSASIDGPAHGFRLIDLDGRSTGSNPVRDAALVWTLADGSTVTDEAEGVITWMLSDGSTATEVEPGEAISVHTVFSTIAPEGAVRVDVADPDGNTGGLNLP
jgi:neutral ceramidase